ncbi:hypothetical protein A1Q2_02918 [Trichosporon asahii var. asahii CBS 8904]|uniref:Uncharacterized protein n=1 Tax=Trichosporon asahii var. asahii (strain CBS 8904) TaxID=1220162 RepID=K1W137_TRIAC|nr:hypothetical protein A1Q2_02918 [Trichosporon asahii var. asahii CBS 8904]
MVLLSLLTAVIAIAHPAVAEMMCCGELSKWDEKKAWAQREIFCNNPRGAFNNGEAQESYWSGKNEFGREKEYDRRKSGPLKPAFFYGRIDEKGRNFDNCWRATQELIEQCARQGKAFGSWKDEGEAYGMTLTGELDTRQKVTVEHFDVSRRSAVAPLRRRLAKRSVDELSSISSHHHLRRLVKDGQYFDVDGEDIHVSFRDTVADLPKRDLPSGSERGADGLWRRSEGLQTTDGMAHHWEETYHADVNVATMLREGLAKIKREEARVGGPWNTTLFVGPELGKRQLEGPTSSMQCWNQYLQDNGAGYTWTVIESGTFLSGSVPTTCVGNEYLNTGGRSDPLKLQKEEELCESFSIPFSVKQLQHLVRQFAHSRGLEWKACYKQSDLPDSARCADKWRATKGE